jgi:hypothetical protein
MDQQPDINTMFKTLQARQQEEKLAKKENITISKDVFYSIVDYAHPTFAICTQQELVSTAEHEGFARRLLNRIPMTGAQPSEKTVSMKFERNRVNKRLQMEEQFISAQEQMFASEDRGLVSLAFKNKASRIVRVKRNEVTGQLLAQVRSIVTDNDIPVYACLMGSRFYSDNLIANPEIRSMFDPSSKIENVMRGNMGHLYGMPVMSDAFRTPEHRVIDPDACVFFGAPAFLGTLCVNEGQVPTVTIGSDMVEWDMPYEASIQGNRGEAMSLLIVED